MPGKSGAAAQRRTEDAGEAMDGERVTVDDAHVDGLGNEQSPASTPFEDMRTYMTGERISEKSYVLRGRAV